MELIYIANSRIPTEKAHGLQIMKMCEAFALHEFYNARSDNETDKQSLKVDLVIPRRYNSIQKSAFDYYRVKRIFKIIKIPCIDLMPLVQYLPLRKLISKTAFFIRVFSFNFSSFFYLLFKRKDIIYTRDKFFLFYALFTDDLVYEAHTVLNNYSFYSPFLRKVKKIVVTSQTIKEDFISKGIEDAKIILAPNGIDLEEFDIQKSKAECRKELNLPLNKKIVLYTGHLYEWKGVDILAKSSRFLPKDINIYFVGGTDRDFNRFRDRYADDRQIHIVKRRPHYEIPVWLKAADILVLPDSSENRDSVYGASPVKMFEYMASQRPIVASDLPYIKEVLNKSNAVLVKPDNPKRLAGGIKKVFQNPELSSKISNRALRDVQVYSWKKRVEKIFLNLLL